MQTSKDCISPIFFFFFNDLTDSHSGKLVNLGFGGGVSGLGVALALPVSITGSLSFFLDVLLCLLPARSPAAVHLCGSPVRFGRASEGTVVLSDVTRLFRQLVFIYEAALLLAGQFRVSPRLFLAGCKDPVEDHAAVVHQGGDEEHVLPLFSRLGRSQSENITVWLWEEFRFC